jgi:uncharacterized glyoxalase superfamily metalloenzyme YdcJ
MANTITADEIREQFSQAMSAMYQQEVPQYGTLLELVADVNLAVLENNPTLHEKLANADELARLNVERHGAIRVGTAQELSTLRRMFAVMGMYPVSYYDLSQAGVPVHSTAFRPIDDASLSRNPFRVFTSLLRLELIENAALRQKPLRSSRNAIFSLAVVTSCWMNLMRRAVLHLNRRKSLCMKRWKHSAGISTPRSMKRPITHCITNTG